MLPVALAQEFARDALLTHDEMRAAGIGTRDVAELVRRGEIVRVARNLSV
ncbi:type IV toxin-antitoxin system AbiEi family antitoxin domain-containing protein [Microvirga massiliensis]|nr:type IV toxin-antitoxin system AbiEi family antitoxin domain-containing protein [Microvirga massiliensis]